MTYPPQGPYGQQPPPTGPQPGWGQQGQQPGGWQQQGWDPNIGWQQGWDAGEPPEPKKRTGLVVGVIVAVLLIGGAVAVTGFWKPGFFLTSDEKPTGGGQPSSSAPQSPGPTSGAPTGIPKPSIQPPGGSGVPSTPPAGGGGSGDEAAVLQVAQATADGFNERDQDKFSEQFCEPEEARKLKLDTLPPDAKMTLTGDPTITGDKATVPVEITTNGDKNTDKMPLENRADGWCTSTN